MATLVLTAVGTIVGGPIGGAIGALLGQQVDSRLFAPKRSGPRLGDLTVQTSSYGSDIPRLFGTLRVAGTVIWSTDLIEDRHKSGGSKGKPKTTTYSYSASFAVALSGRPVRAVHRIWADGKLLRGSAGDWKSDLGAFRLHPGDEGQAADPLIAAAEGIANAPAHRGVAYAVFEDLQLADFGNHIPSLTFEVEADADAVTIGAIAQDLAGAALVGDTIAALGGYAASGESVRAGLEALASAGRISLADDGAVLRLTDAVAAPVALDDAELGATIDKAVERRQTVTRAAGALPDEIAVSYYEPSRDYQAGLQRARRGGGPGRRVESVDLAAAIPAGQAKAIAEGRLADAWAARAGVEVALPWRRLDLRPGATVSLDPGGPVHRIAALTLERMVLRLKLTALAGGIAPVPAANPGRGTAGPDAPHGPTTLALLDLPPLDALAATTPRLWIAAAGVEDGWRSAALVGSIDGGASWQELGATAAPATMGAAVGALAPAGAALLDTVNHVDVELLNETMALAGRDDDALVAGDNLAMLGDELLQFGSAEPLGSRRYRLSRLLRGRRGSDWAIGAHAAGERFVLIDAATLLPYDLPVGAMGAAARVLATGIGDTGAVEADRIANARALRPPAPVDLAALRLGDGTVRFSWVRRSRSGWGWLDGGDAPLGEESERYRLAIVPSVGAARTVETTIPSYDYAPADQAADGAGAAGAFDVELVQLGAIAPSLPAAATTLAA